VAIGGLMEGEANRGASGLPARKGNMVTRNLVGNTANTMRKKELVVLIKPTIIRNAEDWQRTTDQALASFNEAPQRTIVVNAPAAGAVPAAAAAARAAPLAAPAPPPAALIRATAAPLAAVTLPAAGYHHR